MKSIQINYDKFIVRTQDEITDRLVKKLERNLNRICRDEIDEDYLWEAILESDIFVYHETNTKQINAVMMIFMKKKYVKVEMLCSKRRGLGSKLLRVADKIAKQKRKKMIKLISLSGNETFYMKNGYAFTKNPCARNPTIKRKFDQDEDGYPMTKCVR